MLIPCPCDPARHYSKCCQPFITGQQTPETAEQLMRSRYSAYAYGVFEYVLATYTESERARLNLAGLKQDADNTHWIALKIVQSSHDSVEFRAYYHDKHAVYQLHERSSFVREENQWRYSMGQIMADSGEYNWPRNDPCWCGSSKKHKKCCN